AKTPQFDTTGSGDFENISPLNPLPVVVDGIVQDMKEIQKTQNDILEKMVRPPELFYIDDFKVPAGEFRQYSEFNPDLKLGTLDDMRMYGYFYFGAQSYSGNHSYRIMVRQKPFGTGGSVAIDNQS